MHLIHRDPDEEDMKKAVEPADTETEQGFFVDRSQDRRLVRAKNMGVELRSILQRIHDRVYGGKK